MRDFEGIVRLASDVYGRSEKWEAVRARAIARNLTPAHICKAIGMSPSAWNSWKNSRTLPSWDTLELLTAEIDRQDKLMD